MFYLVIPFETVPFCINKLYRKQRPYIKRFIKLLFLVTVLIAAIPAASANAHSPHVVINHIEVSPHYNQDKTVYIIMRNHLLRSIDGGYEWKDLVNGLDNKFIFSSVAVSPFYRRDGLVYVSSDGDGVYRSRDYGESWEVFNEGIGTPRIGLLCMSPSYREGGLLLAAGVEGGLYMALLTKGEWQPVIKESIKVTAIDFSSDVLSKTVVAGDDQGNIWLSKDGGKTWQYRNRIEENDRITAVAVSDNYSNDKTFFIGTERQGLFRTIDGGETFQCLKGGPSDESFHCADKNQRLNSGKHVMSIALVPDYGKNRTVYVTTWYDAVYRSADGGDTWEVLRKGISHDRQANAPDYHVPHFRDLKLSSDFKLDGTLFLAGFDGFFKSTDRGQEWKKIEILPVMLIRGFGISPSFNDNYCVGITTYGGGAYNSIDRGNSWEVLNFGLRTTRLSDIEYSPDYWKDQLIFSASSQRFLIFNNHPNRWRQVQLEYDGWRKPAARILKRVFNVPNEHLLKKRHRAKIWPMAIAISPEYIKDHTIFIGTRRHGVLKSQNGGVSWSSIDNWRWPIGFIYSLCVSPNFGSDQTLFAAVRGHGIYKSADGGVSWKSSNKGFEFFQEVNRPIASNYNIDPVLFSSLKEVYLEISPNYKNDRTVFAFSGVGLFKTTDGGIEWTKVQSGSEIVNNNILALAISPNYSEDQFIMISAKGKGLFASNDGGHNFQQIGFELIGKNQNILWIKFSPNFENDRTIFAASEEKVFRSDDSGITWKALPRFVRYEDWRGEGEGPVRFNGSWKRVFNVNYSASSANWSDTIGDTVVLDFIGSGVSWIGPKGPDLGVAQVYIDGKLIDEIKQYSIYSKPSLLLFQSPILEHRHHELKIKIIRGKDIGSNRRKIIVDAFDVIL